MPLPRQRLSIVAAVCYAAGCWVYIALYVWENWAGWWSAATLAYYAAIRAIIWPVWLVVWMAGSADVTPKYPQELSENVAFLGSTMGLAEVCARNPAVSVDESLKWTGRALRLSDIGIRYTERVAPEDKTAKDATVLMMGLKATQQHENPERVWDDPKGCGSEMKAEIDGIIADWSKYLE